jgi:hypothetical protein
MIMEPQRATMLRQLPPPNIEEIASRARMCADIFLRGCAAYDRGEHIYAKDADD